MTDQVYPPAAQAEQFALRMIRAAFIEANGLPSFDSLVTHTFKTKLAEDKVGSLAYLWVDLLVTDRMFHITCVINPEWRSGEIVVESPDQEDRWKFIVRDTAGVMVVVPCRQTRTSRYEVHLPMV